MCNRDNKWLRILTIQGPAWSPDGSQIIFGLSEHGIYTINADGSNQILVLPVQYYLTGYFEWGADPNSSLRTPTLPLTHTAPEH